MPWYFWPLLLIYFLVCIFLILVILLQAGKGGGMSSLMGGGGGLGEQIGATSVEKTLNKWTTACAASFAVLAILLAIIGARHSQDNSVLGQIERETAAAQKAAEEAAEAAEDEIPATAPTTAPASTAPVDKVAVEPIAPEEATEAPEASTQPVS